MTPPEPKDIVFKPLLSPAQSGKRGWLDQDLKLHRMSWLRWICCKIAPRLFIPKANQEAVKSFQRKLSEYNIAVDHAALMMARSGLAKVSVEGDRLSVSAKALLDLDQLKKVCDLSEKTTLELLDDLSEKLPEDVKRLVVNHERQWLRRRRRLSSTGASPGYIPKRPKNDSSVEARKLSSFNPKPLTQVSVKSREPAEISRVTAQNPLAKLASTPLQPSEAVKKGAKNESLPIKYEQLSAEPRTIKSESNDPSSGSRMVSVEKNQTPVPKVRPVDDGTESSEKSKKGVNINLNKQKQAFNELKRAGLDLADDDFNLLLNAGLLNDVTVPGILNESLRSLYIPEFKSELEKLRGRRNSGIQRPRNHSVKKQSTKKPSIAEDVTNLYSKMKNKKDLDRHPLIESENELNDLIKGIDLKTNNENAIINALRSFRRLQKHQDVIGVKFTPSMFSVLLRNKELETDATEIDFSGMDYEVRQFLDTPESRLNARKEALKNAFVIIGRSMDVIPAVTNIDEIKAKGIRPHGSGLYNWGNTCFMNSSLQVLALQLGSVEGINEVMNYHPDNHTPQQLDMHSKLKQSFAGLCRAINDRNEGAVLLVDLQRQFMRDYLFYSQAMGRGAAKFILETEDPSAILPGRIEQQDPQEFINDLSDIFGIQERDGSSVLVYEKKKMISDGRVRLTKTKKTGDRLNVIPISVRRNGAGSIRGCLLEHTSEEVLDEENRFRWDAADLQKAALSPGYMPETSKQIGFVCSGPEAPKRLTLQMKIFEYTDGLAKKLNEKSQGILKNLSRRVELPIAKRIHDVPQTIGNSQSVAYQINGIVCHRGDTTTSGHYIGIRFEGDKVIVCDDDVVLELNDYARFHGRAPYKGWKDFCEQEMLGGYLFTLEKLDEGR